MRAPHIVSHAFRLERLHIAINDARPFNGFIRRDLILAGWTGQPDYHRNVR